MFIRNWDEYIIYYILWESICWLKSKSIGIIYVVFPNCNYFKQELRFIIYHLHKVLQPFLVKEDADGKGMPTSTVLHNFWTDSLIFGVL
jgi:hypothetical protein